MSAAGGGTGSLVAGVDTSTQSCTVVVRDAATGALVRHRSHPRRRGGRMAQLVITAVLSRATPKPRWPVATHRHGPDPVPAVSTIWRILSARGFVTPQPHNRSKSSYQRFAADQPNERHDRIDNSGVITLRHDSRLHHIGLGRRYAGTPVLVLVHDLHIRVLSTSGQLLRELTLDPTRDYQPQAPT